ncbi:SMI1/KNR4 family protein [Candidatus Tisiphia endosymbiont of Piscicola geometra]|uniref:SMI1/KNR4 family protein n=1 Tax=Candidatus Tisiphia endosymbiont of Piscicola geometra TaxID=3066273 RepID=UPI00312C9326
MMNNIEVEESKRPTNLEEIEKFEKLIQAKLPKDYKKFLLKHNGGHPITETFKLIEPVNAKNTEIGVEWFFALYDGEYSNLTLEFQRTRDELIDKLVVFLPIAYDSGGKICLSIRGDDYGKLYYWTTNWSFWDKDDLDYLYLISNNFTDFINGLYRYELDDNDNIIRRYQDGTVTIEPLRKHE